MTPEQKLVKALKSLNPQVAELMVAEVLDTNSLDTTCTVKPIGMAERYKVRLRSSVDETGKGKWAMPAKGSTVIVGAIGADTANLCVLMMSEIESYHIEIDNKKFLIDSDGIFLNGSANKGLVKLDPLNSNLNALKQYAEQLNQAVSTALSAIGEGPTASGSAGQAAFQSSMAGTGILLQEMENETVRHGG